MKDRLGIIDWGIGGIGIYKLLKERSNVPVTYFSDTGVTPYGKMTRRELTARLEEVITFLKTRDATYIVIGCNAASTAAPFVRDQGVPVVGIIDSAVDAAAAADPCDLGVIGGRRTVLSRVYRNAFRTRGVEVKQRIAQPLSGMIESGDISSNRLHAETRRILDPLKHCSHILLACTHYPAVIPVLARYVSPQTKFIDPAESLVQKLNLPEFLGGGEDEFFTSGDAADMRRAARAAFGVELSTVKVHKQ